MRQEAYENMCSIHLEGTAEEVKTQTVKYVTQLKDFNSMLQLPQVLKLIEEQEEQREKKVVAFKNSQEGGRL